MTDTAQSQTGTAETDAIADAANAFKATLGQIAPPEKPRDDRGRFAAEQAEADTDEIDADDEAPAAADAEPEADDEADTDDAETADSDEESQPDDVAMPASWAKEDAETWAALPPEAKAKIAEREGQRDAAVNQKFQEAANVRRQNEAVIREAAQNRDRFAELAEVTLSLIRPQEPPLTMLDVNSDDYDPDGFHLARARYEQQIAQFQGLNAQLQHAAQARDAERQRDEMALYQHINTATRDALVRDVPAIGDQAKAPQVIGELIEYAKSIGAPDAMFETPTTALEWHVLWKAQQFDKLQQAKGRVANTPAPEPRKAQPAVRPGVATTRSAAKHAQQAKDLKRLNRTGSVEDGAAIWKHILRG